MVLISNPEGSRNEFLTLALGFLTSNQKGNGIEKTWRTLLVAMI